MVTLRSIKKLLLRAADPQDDADVAPTMIVTLPDFCLRCPDTELVPTPSPSREMAFFECPGCRRAYAREPGGQLVFRWPHPIGIALYGFAFRSGTSAHHVQSAVHDMSNGHSPDHVALLIDEIELELLAPTQQVSRMLPHMQRSEEECRHFLRSVVDGLKRFSGQAPHNSTQESA